MSGLSVRFLLMILISAASFSWRAVAAGENSIERIGGNFTVTKITKQSKGFGFLVEFKASEGSPKISRLRLETDHINAGLAEGETIRLSADVRALSGDVAEVEQVVVFLPGRAGPTPVWMLSKRAKVLAPPAKLLEMHAPSTDYAVF